MSKTIEYLFIPDYFIVDGKKIGKQDPSYDEMVAKYCRQKNVVKEVKADESKES